MKIPFDIKYRPQIESGEYKVVTRDGRPARIICWDRFTTEPNDSGNIVVLVAGIEFESTYYYYQDGHLWNQANGEGYSQLDLFIITPEPELTEFEEKVKELIGSYPIATNKNKGSLLYEVQKAAVELLELAKKEICKGCSANLEGYIKGRQDIFKEMSDYMQEKFTMGNPFIQKLDPNVVIDTTTSGTFKKD